MTVRPDRSIGRFASGLAVGLLLAGLLTPLAFAHQLAGTSSATPALTTGAAPATGAGGGTQTVGDGTGSTANEVTGQSGAVQSASAKTGTAPGSRVTGAAAAAGVTDIGVTATTIKLGVGLLDTGGLSQAGVDVVASTADQQTAWQAFIDDLNSRGGVAGRKVEAAFHKYDILSEASMRAACLYWTEEAKVFAVVEAFGYFGPPVLCITQEHQTPFLARGGVGIPADYFTKSQGRLFVFTQGGDRMMRNLAAELGALKGFKGDKVGIVDGGSLYSPQTVDILQSALTKAGHTVVRRSTLAADMDTAASQVPLEVQQMRVAGATEVILNTDLVLSTQWVNAASSQGWNPRYYASDWAAMSGDFSTIGMPAAFDGSIAFTVTRNGDWRAGWPEPPTEVHCRQIYEGRTGKKLNRSGSTNDNNAYLDAIAPCSPLALFEAGATAVGHGLTRAALSAAIQAIGPFAATSIGGGSFRPGKFDAPDLIRTEVWDKSCTCWRPAGTFHPGAF